MKKTILTIALTAVICFAAVGTTFAWLVAKTPSITNTFTVGDVSITLVETTGNEYKLIPGHTYAKDPKVTVATGSETCWLFVKAESVNNVSNYVTYEIADGWTKLEVSGTDGVYYREVAADATTREFSVLAGDTIKVLDSLTTTELATAKTSVPSLTFTAYAVQKDGFATAAAAWDEAKKLG